MPVMLDLRVCQLLTSRLCHDLSGPIAAISNGAELLGDDDPDFAREAAGLIAESGRTAAKRLQLFRFVYGFNQGALAGPPPHALVGEYFAGTAIACDYPAAARDWLLERQRLAGNLLIVAGDALPRGGQLSLKAEADGVLVEGSGDGGGPSAEACAALNPATPVDVLTSRTVVFYIAGKIAEALGWRLIVSTEPGRFRIGTAPLTGAS
jgi:histidine phosphotransferase ChpT